MILEMQRIYAGVLKYDMYIEMYFHEPGVGGAAILKHRDPSNSFNYMLTGKDHVTLMWKDEHGTQSND